MKFAHAGCGQQAARKSAAEGTTTVVFGSSRLGQYIACALVRFEDRLSYQERIKMMLTKIKN